MEMDAANFIFWYLVIPQAMEYWVLMKPDFGPILPKPFRTQKDVDMS